MQLEVIKRMFVRRIVSVLITVLVDLVILKLLIDGCALNPIKFHNSMALIIRAGIEWQFNTASLERLKISLQMRFYHIKSNTKHFASKRKTMSKPQCVKRYH